MRNSLRYCALFVIAAVGVASLNTGCRSTGWNMPGSSWVSWGKKKPPASSIAGTRDSMQPPSVSVPPYPADDPSSSSASNMALASQPATSPQGDLPGGYGPTAARPTGGVASGIQTASAASGYATGPYGTGGGGSAMPPTQQGFYRTSTPESGGPVAATADARGGYSPTPDSQLPAPAYAGSGYPAPPNYGAAPYGAEVPPTGGNYAPVSTPAPDYGATGYSAPDQGYPAPVSNGPYATSPPTTTYPTTAAGNGYPVTRPDVIVPQGASGAYPANAMVPPTTYGATPYAAGPAAYGDAAAYGASSQYGTYGANSGYGSATGSATGASNTYGGYLPGSTSRNNGLLNPAGAPSPSTPAATYPNTYNR